MADNNHGVWRADTDLRAPSGNIRNTRGIAQEFFSAKNLTVNAAVRRLLDAVFRVSQRPVRR
jgi:hypothetical protein